MTDRPPLTREAQLDTAVAAVRAILGRDATEVEVDVTRSGTVRVVARCDGVAKAATHQWRAR